MEAAERRAEPPRWGWGRRRRGHGRGHGAHRRPRRPDRAEPPPPPRGGAPRAALPAPGAPRCRRGRRAEGGGAGSGGGAGGGGERRRCGAGGGGRGGRRLPLRRTMVSPGAVDHPEKAVISAQIFLSGLSERRESRRGGWRKEGGAPGGPEGCPRLRPSHRPAALSGAARTRRPPPRCGWAPPSSAPSRAWGVPVLGITPSRGCAGPIYGPRKRGWCGASFGGHKEVRPMPAEGQLVVGGSGRL